MGLAIPLGDFLLSSLEKNRPITIMFAPALEDDPASWQFEQLRPDGRVT